MFFKVRLIVLFLAGLSVALTADAAAAEKTCLDCHKKVTAKRVVHAALNQYVRMEQGCATCHTAPHAKKKGELSLAAAVPELCYQCHDKAIFTKQNVHQPVAGGDCLACHNPHATDAPRLLNQHALGLCQSCHPDKINGKHIFGRSGISDNHPIQGRIDPSRKGRELGCTSCHNPHSSRKAVLLVNDESNSPADLCLLCHSKITVRP